MTVNVQAFFHEPTYTVSYVVIDQAGENCVIIDSVLDYDSKSGRTATAAADILIDYVNESRLEVSWILETHVHADHLTAAPYLKSKLGGDVCIGANIPTVQKVFKGIFNVDESMPVDGQQFDRLLQDDEIIKCGEMDVHVLLTPGHTPACVSYVIGDVIFVGDTLFMPDYGTARCDFPGGDAAQLYTSIQKILSYPAETRLFMCHDYGPGGRDYDWETTVAEQRMKNIHINDDVSKEAFVKMRQDRDAQLDMPALILPSVQVNMCAGHFPKPEENGVSYLKIPVDWL